MGLQILRERLRLGEERLAIDRVAASLCFERTGNARRPDQRRRAAQCQNETETSHDQSPGSPDQLNQVYKLGASMPSPEVRRRQARVPWLFACGQRVRLFLSCRDTAIIDAPQTTEEFDAKRQCWRWRRSARLGRLVRSLLPGRRPFQRRGPITPRLKKLPVADLDRVAHGDAPGSAALMDAAALLAAAAIGTAPDVTSRLFAIWFRVANLRDCLSRRRRFRPAPVST
jgi:hypothetical protein